MALTSGDMLTRISFTPLLRQLHRPAAVRGYAAAVGLPRPTGRPCRPPPPVRPAPTATRLLRQHDREIIWLLDRLIGHCRPLRVRSVSAGTTTPRCSAIASTARSRRRTRMLVSVIVSLYATISDLPRWTDSPSHETTGPDTRARPPAGEQVPRQCTGAASSPHPRKPQSTCRSRVLDHMIASLTRGSFLSANTRQRVRHPARAPPDRCHPHRCGGWR
jgi:hypothetical protein